MIPSPLESGAATIHMVSLTGEPSLAWEYYEGLADQGAIAQGGNGGVYKAVVGGQSLYGSSSTFSRSGKSPRAPPSASFFPEEGVSAVTEPVAILSTANNPEAAKAFVDFLLSEKG